MPSLSSFLLSFLRHRAIDFPVSGIVAAAFSEQWYRSSNYPRTAPFRFLPSARPQARAFPMSMLVIAGLTDRPCESPTDAFHAKTFPSRLSRGNRSRHNRARDRSVSFLIGSGVARRYIGGGSQDFGQTARRKGGRKVSDAARVEGRKRRDLFIRVRYRGDLSAGLREKSGTGLQVGWRERGYNRMRARPGPSVNKVIPPASRHPFHSVPRYLGPSYRLRALPFRFLLHIHTRLRGGTICWN